MEQKTYTEEEVQRLVNQQKTVTTWENMMDRLGGSMTQAEFNMCESFRRMLLAPAVPPAPSPDQKEGEEGGGKYPD